LYVNTDVFVVSFTEYCSRRLSESWSVFNVTLLSLNQGEAYQSVCSQFKFHPRQIVAFHGRRTRVCELRRLDANYATYSHSHAKSLQVRQHLQ